MLRFPAILELRLRRALKQGDLDAELSEHTRGILGDTRRAKDAFVELVQVCHSHQAFAAADKAARRAKSERPWRKWLKENWAWVLMKLAEIALRFLI